MSSTRVNLGTAGGYTFYKSIAEELHGFSKKEDLIVVTAAQLNRGAYDNLDSGLDSIADSLGVIQTADIVMAILSNEQLRSMNQSMIKFLKNRYTGQLNSHLVETDFSTVRFLDLDEDVYSSNPAKELSADILSKIASGEVTTTKPDLSVINFD